VDDLILHKFHAFIICGFIGLPVQFTLDRIKLIPFIFPAICQILAGHVNREGPEYKVGMLV
jgi:hypothetical protein